MGLTTVGREWVIDRLQNVESPAGALMQWIAWGTGGATAEAVGQTALATAAAEARVSGTLSQPTSTTDRCVGTLTSASTQTISEVGRFNASTGGTMIQRHVFTGIPLVSGDSIQFTLDLTD